MVLKEFFDSFLTSCKVRGLSERTILDRKDMIRHFIEPALGDRDISSLKIIDMEKILAKTLGRGESNRIHAITTYRGILKHIIDHGHKLKFDWREVETPKYIQRKQPDYLTREEIAVIRTLFSSKNKKDIRYRALFEVLLHSGMRIRECLTINRFTDIDYINEEATIINAKSKVEEKVYLSGGMSYLNAYLATRTDTDPALFYSYDGPLTYDAAKSFLRWFRKRANPHIRKHITWHLFRRTYGTWLLQEKVDIKSVQYLMRHKSERTTLKYYIAVDKERCKFLHREVMKDA